MATTPIPEVIANLDVLEDQIRNLADQVREYRYLLFASLDSDPNDMVE